MKRTLVSATALAVALALVTGCSSSGKGSNGGSSSGGGTKSSASGGGGLQLSTDGKGKTINVWLQSDAKTGWPAVVTQATQRFEAETGAKVNVNWQQWANYPTKLDSTFSGKTGIPDVVELGNTQVASYVDAGAFADLTGIKNKFANSGSWLQGLTESATSTDGKLQAIPYYAGSRVVIYRKDLWTAAGITSTPTTIDELNADLAKVKAANAGKKGFSAFYMPGKYWYAAMSLVYGAGGKIATQDGKTWKGALESPQAQQGLAEWQKLATQYSVGGATTDESTQDAVMAKGNVASIVGNGWEVGAVSAPKTGNPALASKLSTFPFPGTSAGSYTPSFLGGSDLAVPAKSANGGLGAEWIRIFTDTTSQTQLAKFAIPNTTSLLSAYEKLSQANQSTGEAAKNTWFVPNVPTWANVESNNVLQNMLESIATGKASIAAAAKTADAQIGKILNGSN